MTSPSKTRRELESRLRAVLPAAEDLKELSDRPSSIATAGVSGLLTGYVWGRVRGWRSARRRRR